MEEKNLKPKGSKRPFKKFRPKPVKVGNTYEVEVFDVSNKGDGIAKVKGFIVFVKGAKTGFKGKVKIDRVFRRFAIASVV